MQRSYSFPNDYTAAHKLHGENKENEFPESASVFNEGNFTEPSQGLNVGQSDHHLFNLDQPLPELRVSRSLSNTSQRSINPSSQQVTSSRLPESTVKDGMRQQNLSKSSNGTVVAESPTSYRTSDQRGRPLKCHSVSESISTSSDSSSFDEFNLNRPPPRLLSESFSSSATPPSEISPNYYVPDAFTRIFKEAVDMDEGIAVPEFVVREPSRNDRERKVDVILKKGKTIPGLLTYTAWNQGYGYWLLITQQQHKAIVKYHKNKPPGYRAWRGYEQRFSSKPIAFPASEEVQAETTEALDDTDDLEESNESEIGRHELRKRNGTFAPYTEEKLKRKGATGKAADKDIRVSSIRKRGSTDTGDEDSYISEATSVSTSAKKKRKQAPIISNTTVEGKMSMEEMKERTKLMVVIDDDEEDLAVPIYLSNCESVPVLYDKILLASDMEEADIRKIKIVFPWKSEGKVMMLKREIDDCYQLILQEMESWWKDNASPCTMKVLLTRKNEG